MISIYAQFGGLTLPPPSPSRPLTALSSPPLAPPPQCPQRRALQSMRTTFYCCSLILFVLLYNVHCTCIIADYNSGLFLSESAGPVIFYALVKRVGGEAFFACSRLLKSLRIRNPAHFFLAFKNFI